MALGVDVDDAVELTAGAVNGAAVLWESATHRQRGFADLRDRGCSLAWNGLSRTEWAQYAPAIRYQDSDP